MTLSSLTHSWSTCSSQLWDSHRNNPSHPGQELPAQLSVVQKWEMPSLCRLPVRPAGSCSRAAAQSLGRGCRARLHHLTDAEGMEGVRAQAHWVKALSNSWVTWTWIWAAIPALQPRARGCSDEQCVCFSSHMASLRGSLTMQTNICSMSLGHRQLAVHTDWTATQIPVLHKKTPAKKHPFF